MNKFLSAAFAAALVSCATAPAPAPAAAPPAPAPLAAAAAPAPAVTTVTYEEPLPVSVKSFYPNGDASGSVTTKYTAEGQLLSQETYNGNGVLIETRAGKARAGVWRITVTNAQTGETVSLEDRTVGPQGELLVQTLLNAKEVPQASNEYTYSSGRRVQWLAKTGSGAVQARTSYLYDAKGNNTRTEVYDAGGALTNVFVSTYNDLGQITARQGFDAWQNLVEQTAFTWKDGRKVKEETTKPLLRSTEYSYGPKDAATGIVLSVRGKVVERQTIDYQWFTKTKTVNP
jgi:hypothetical protein